MQIKANRKAEKISVRGKKTKAKMWRKFYKYNERKMSRTGSLTG